MELLKKEKVKNKKILIIIVVVLAFLIIAIPVVIITVKNLNSDVSLYYELKEDGTYMVTGCSEPLLNKKDLNIPSTYNDKPVTEISGNFLWGKRKIKSVYIPSSVSIINPYSISSCEDVSEFKVAADSKYFCVVDGVLFNKDISHLISFPPNSAIKEYVLPNSVESIGEYAFFCAKKITNITLSENVSKIEERAFCGCSDLNSISISQSLKTIENYAFGVSDGNYWNGHLSCEKLKKVNYTGTIDDWCKIAFGNEYSNPLRYSKELLINDIAIGKEVEISNQVDKINSYTFYNCSNIETITINQSEINANAFYGCVNLSKVIISNKISVIGYNAFSNCSSLVEISYNENMESWRKVTKKDSTLNNTRITCTDGNL